MKNLKTKLMAAISMVLISTLMLTSVSYAWYTLSTNPEVKGIKATAVANENLEIALDNFYANGAAIDTASTNATAGGVQGSTTGNDYTWGNSVDVGSQMVKAADSSNNFELRPAEYVANTGLQTYKYGTDGRISAVQALKEYAGYGPAGASTTADAATASASQINGVAAIYNDDSTTDKNYAFKVVYWLRTNKTGNIDLLSDGVGLADGADASDLATGGGSYISTAQYGTGTDKYPADAIHVAFKVTADGATSSTWVADTDITYTFDDATTPTKVKLAMASGKHIITSATANTAYKVEMYVFLNGDVVTNAMAEAAITDIAVNVQFDNDAISADGAMTY